jgi:uncharacterized membrane protein
MMEQTRGLLGELADSDAKWVVPTDFALKTVAFGVGGWALENALYGPRYSAVWNRAKIPFLPVYAIGGAAIMFVGARLKRHSIPWFLRLPIYGALLTSIEYAGCQIDRKLLKSCSWDYSKQSCKSGSSGCIDWQHAAIWGVLGLAGEGFGLLGRRIVRRRRLTTKS